MKTRNLWAILFLLMAAACGGDNELEQQVPEDIIDTEPCPTLYSRILELFPERNLLAESILFSDSVQKKIVITKATDVYVTYLAEGAGYRNSLLWYSYSRFAPPTSGSQLDLHVLFPDVSSDILTSGNRLKLQDEKFEEGTVIGFVLIINGWQGRVDLNKPRLYTDHQLNANKRQQHILFEEKTCGELVLAFEDNLSLSDENDADYNDIIFTVSDNNSHQLNTSFDDKTIVSW